MNWIIHKFTGSAWFKILACHLVGKNFILEFKKKLFFPSHKIHMENILSINLDYLYSISRNIIIWSSVSADRTYALNALDTRLCIHVYPPINFFFCKLWFIRSVLTSFIKFSFIFLFISFVKCVALSLFEAIVLTSHTNITGTFVCFFVAEQTARTVCPAMNARSFQTAMWIICFCYCCCWIH